MLATTPRAPDVSTSAEFSVGLSPDHPVVSRQVTIEVDPRDAELTAAALLVRVDDESAPFPPDYWITIVPRDPTERVVAPRSQFGELSGDAAQDVLALCKQSCRRDYLIVTRLMDPASAATVRLTTHLEIFRTEPIASPDQAAADPVARLELGEESADDHAFIRSATSGRLEIGGATTGSVWQGELRAPQSALVGDGTTFGGIWVEGFVGGTNDDDTVYTRLFIDGRMVAADWPFVPRNVFTLSGEWLSACDSAADCTLPVRLELAWDCFFPLCPPGTKTWDFSIDARIEYLGQTAPPAEASIELVSR